MKFGRGHPFRQIKKHGFIAIDADIHIAFSSNIRSVAIGALSEDSDASVLQRRMRINRLADRSHGIVAFCLFCRSGRRGPRFECVFPAHSLLVPRCVAETKACMVDRGNMHISSTRTRFNWWHGDEGGFNSADGTKTEAVRFSSVFRYYPRRRFFIGCGAITTERALFRSGPGGIRLVRDRL